MKDILTGLARFVPAFFETLISLTIHPRATGVRVVRDSNVTNACVYFALCVVLTQLFRFRVRGDFDEIAKIGTADIGWKAVVLLLLVVYLAGIASISKQPDPSRVAVFTAFSFGTLSIVFQSMLIVAAGMLETSTDVFGGCVRSVGPYSSPRVIDTEECGRLAAAHPIIHSGVFEPLATIMLVLLVPLALAWLYKTLRVYSDCFLGEERRFLSMALLVVTSPLVVYVAFQIRASFLRTVLARGV